MIAINRSPAVWPFALRNIHISDLLPQIIEGAHTHSNMAYAVAAVDNKIIDEINILQASFNAMHCCVDELKIKPGFLLIDGNRFKPYRSIPHQCIIKGDGKYASIAAASILAKTYRDDFMLKIHPDFPQYGWNKNKGYGTAAHRNAIEEYGLCPLHRKSYNIQPAAPILL